MSWCNASRQIVVSFTYVYASRRPEVMTAAQSSSDENASSLPDMRDDVHAGGRVCQNPAAG